LFRWSHLHCGLLWILREGHPFRPRTDRFFHRAEPYENWGYLNVKALYIPSYISIYIIYRTKLYIYIYLSIYGSCWLYVDYMFVKYWIILAILDYVGDIGLWWSYYHIGLCWVILGDIGLNCYSIEKHIINIKQLDWGNGGIFSGIFYPNILGGITGIYTCMYILYNTYTVTNLMWFSASIAYRTTLRCEMMMNHWILGCPIVRHNRVVERSSHENLNNHGFRSFEIDVSVYNSWSYANISPLLVESDINTHRSFCGGDSLSYF
jgi:hypothetical protein